MKRSKADAKSSIRFDALIRSAIYNPQIRDIFFQAMLVLFLVVSTYYMFSNLAANLQRLNIASGFGFLSTTAGFGIIQSVIEYSEDSSFGRALLVGFLNTLLVAFIGILLATIIGFIVGIARLSQNRVISALASCYVEVVRNIPLLVQIFFWYIAALRAVPGKREKWSFFFDTMHINVTGLRIPRPIYSDGSSAVIASLILAIAIAIGISIWARRRQAATGQQFPSFRVGLAFIILLPTIVYFLSGMPISLQHPEFIDTGPRLRQGFALNVGINLIPEFLSVLLALSIYTAAYIAEIVRAGILGVSHGQSEAAHSLGLRRMPALRLVVIPQAMRIIIPPLTNQYLNLTKNSSLAAAIAYPDLVSVGGVVLNQSGQAVEVIMIWMVIYLGLSIGTSLLMNWYNRFVALVER